MCYVKHGKNKINIWFNIFYQKWYALSYAFIPFALTHKYALLTSSEEVLSVRSDLIVWLIIFFYHVSFLTLAQADRPYVMNKYDHLKSLI